MKRKRAGPGIRKYVGADGVTTYQVRATKGKETRTATAPSLKMAKQVRSKFLLELAEAEHFPNRKRAERIRLADFIERYQNDYLKVKAARSYRAEATRLRRIRELLGNPWLDEVTIADVERLLANLRQQGRGPATANRYRTRLRHLFVKAIAWRYLSENPTAGTERLREPSLGDRFLQPHEFRALLAACDPDLRVLAHVAAATGMRQNELIRLDWSDVDLDLGFLTVRAANSKTAEARRVPLNPEVQAVLRDLGPSETGSVFGFEWFPRKRWNAAIKRMGWDRTEVQRLRGWRFHDMRHCCASWLAMADVPLSKIAKILGHKTLSMVQRYSHLSDDSLVLAVDRIQYAASPTDAIQIGQGLDTEPSSKSTNPRNPA